MAWRGRGRGRSSYSTYTSYPYKKTSYSTSSSSGTSNDKPLPHKIEYSRSSRATCRGTGACGGKIEVDSLRHGKEERSRYQPGETTTEWRHWGCVTPAMLKAMKSKGADKIPGFYGLSTEDRARVTADIKAGRIGTSVAPTTAPVASSSGAAEGSATTAATSLSTAQVTTDPQTQTSKKRKQPATEEPRATQVSASSSSASLRRTDSVAPPATQIVAEEDLDAANNEPAYEADEVYVAFPTKIVGVRYYTGMVGAGELVSVVREPTNQYDRNAIRILNASGTQVGHIPRTVAAKLAPLMDQGRVSVEGVMKNGNLSGRYTYELDMTLNICGPSNPARRRELEPLLVWATPGQRGFPVPGPGQPPNQTGVAGTSLSPKKGQKNASAAAAGPSNAASQLQQQQLIASQKAVELSRMMAGLAKVDDSARRATVLDALCGEDILELPVHEDSPRKAKGQLKNDLLRHQI